MMLIHQQFQAAVLVALAVIESMTCNEYNEDTWADATDLLENIGSEFFDDKEPFIKLLEVSETPQSLSDGL